nr:hypothetical protein HK105_007644 [Polyrhizophydium stewartii]
MGNAESGMEPVESYCKVQALASKRCMNENDFDRDKYRTACAQQFQDYRDCKRRWAELRKQILDGQANEK